MTVIDAERLHFRELNAKIRESGREITIDNCLGQRFILSGQSDKEVVINGTPGNALASYLNGCAITVNGNVQDAVGDTMNDGILTVHGGAGDALGYSMRGGKIYIKGSAGYRAGIHMKEYGDKKPVIIIGGTAGSFLGEYMAGGLIVVLNLNDEPFPVGNFTGTGIHGGMILIRGDVKPPLLPAQVAIAKADAAAIETAAPYLKEFCKAFSFDWKEISKAGFTILTPNAKNPYKRLYTNN